MRAEFAPNPKVFLICTACGEKPTPHTFEGKRHRFGLGDAEVPAGTWYEHLYQCELCAHLRVYGTECLGHDN